MAEMEQQQQKDGRVILVAVDHSDISEKAFEWFLDNVYRDGDSVKICHIPENPHLRAFSISEGLKVPYEQWQQALIDAHSKIEKLNDHYEFLLRNRNIKKFESCGEHFNKPGEGILQMAKEKKANLIVVGTRHLDKLGRFFAGSVSDYVVHHSDVPVIVCPMGQSN